MYPKIKKLVIEIDNEADSLTLDQVLEEVHAAYDYAYESRARRLQYSPDPNPNEISGTIFHPDGCEVGTWEMSLYEGAKQ